DLTLLEVLVKPFRLGDAALVSLYRTVLGGTQGFRSVQMTHTILEAAARIRADYRLKSPDAIHASTAIAIGCTLFVTNDSIFRRWPALRIALLSEIAAR